MVTKEQWIENIKNLYKNRDIDNLEVIYNNFKNLANRVLTSKHNRHIDKYKSIADSAKYYIDLYYMLY